MSYSSLVLVGLGLLFCLNAASSKDDDYTGIISINGASDVEANGAYICLTREACQHAEIDAYKLSMVHQMFAGELQRRWYISKSHVYLYGAIELSKSPWTVKPWKRLGIDGSPNVEESNMYSKMGDLDCNLDHKRSSLIEILYLNLAIAEKTLNQAHLSTFDSSLEFSELRSRLSQCADLLTRHIRSENSPILDNVSSDGDNAKDINLVIMSRLDKLVHDANSMPLLSQRLHLLSLCHWAAMEGAWNRVAKDCYKSALYRYRDRDREEDEDVGNFEVEGHEDQTLLIMDGLKKRILLSMVMDVDPKAVLDDVAIYRHVIKRKNTSISESLWVIEKLATLLSRGSIGTIGSTGNIGTAGTISSISRSELGADTTEITKKIQSVRKECQQLQYYAANGSIRDLLTQTCHYLQTKLNKIAQSNEQKQISVSELQLSSDESASLLVSLLGIGAVDTIGTFVCNCVLSQLKQAKQARRSGFIEEEENEVEVEEEQEECSDDDDDDDADIDIDIDIDTSSLDGYDLQMSTIMAHALAQDALSSLIRVYKLEYPIALSTSNVQAAAKLHNLFLILKTQHSEVIRSAAQHDNILAFLVTALLQMTSPSILNSHSNESVVEARLLRILAVDSLHILNMDICPPHSLHSDVYSCSAQDVVSRIGVRGLFLLAYQGIYSNDDDEIYSDIIIPKLYHEFIQRTQQTWPWQYQLGKSVGDSGLAVVTGFTEVTKGESSITTTTSVKAKKSIRVGFVSSYFEQHSVGRLLAPIITGLSNENDHRDVIDVHVVDLKVGGGSKTTSDLVKKSLQESIPSSNWHNLSPSSSSSNVGIGSDPASIARYIRSLQFDVVVLGDNFMDSISGHAIMMRIAPITVAFWGHPFTTGFVDTIDYFVSGIDYECISIKRSWQSHFSEQLVLFESLSFQMFDLSKKEDKVLKKSDDKIRSKSTKSSNKIIVAKDLLNRNIDIDLEQKDSNIRKYACLQSLMKMHPMMDDVISNILATDSNSLILLLENNKQQLWQQTWQKRLSDCIRNQVHSDLAIETNANESANESDVDKEVRNTESRVVFMPQLPHLE